MPLNREIALKELGFKKDAKPSAREIQQAYRKLALRYHPDKTKFPEQVTDAQRTILTKNQSEKFKSIAEAYQFLQNPEKFSHFKEGSVFATFFDVRRHFQELAREQAKTFGMYVVTFIDIRHSRSAYWGMQDIKELNKKCENFYRIPEGHTHSVVKIQISDGPAYSQSPIKLTVEAKKHILLAMKKNRDLIEVKTPDNFFSASQNKQLCAFLNKNRAAVISRAQKAAILAKQKAVAFNSRKRWQLFAWVMSAVAMGLILPIANLSYFTVAVKIGLSALLSGIACVGYQRFSAYASAQYEKLAALPTRVSEAERTAIQLGVESKFWGGYFKSFTRSAAYFHPVAFAAGREHALQDNPEILKKYTKKR